VDNHKQELEKISRSIKQIDVYSEELRSKILVAKRTTLKAEDDLIHQEKEKRRQDYFIDRLTEQLRRLQEKRALYETQLIAQQKETQAAQQTLHDAATEMEAIQFEKRQLLQQWRSSVIGLQRRDDVLHQIQTGISKNEETIASKDSELAGFQRSLRNAQEESETLLGILNKLENEIEHIRKQTMIINDQRDKLRESYQMYSKALEQTEKELQMVVDERNAVLSEINATIKSQQKLSQKNQSLENDISECLQQQLSAEKGAQNWKKTSIRLRNVIHEKESVIATVENEISNTRLDILAYSAKLETLRQENKRIQDESAQKLQLIEKYGLEFKRGQDSLSKKSTELDLLNRKLKQLTDGSQHNESVGPLEATIKNLTNSIKAREVECNQLSQYWLRSQNELVLLTKEISDINEETQDLKMKETVLSRKKMVINSISLLSN
jgi:chromosome segregation ATPase